MAQKPAELFLYSLFLKMYDQSPSSLQIEKIILMWSFVFVNELHCTRKFQTIISIQYLYWLESDVIYTIYFIHLLVFLQWQRVWLQLIKQLMHKMRGSWWLLSHIQRPVFMGLHPSVFRSTLKSSKNSKTVRKKQVSDISYL